MLSYVLCMAFAGLAGLVVAGGPGFIGGVVGFAVFDAMFAAKRRRKRAIGREHRR